nr:hypothetical protein [Tanacetum cinerariifolium]
NMMSTLSNTNNMTLKMKRGPVIYYATPLSSRTFLQFSSLVFKPSADSETRTISSAKIKHYGMSSWIPLDSSSKIRANRLSFRDLENATAQTLMFEGKIILLKNGPTRLSEKEAAMKSMTLKILSKLEKCLKEYGEQSSIEDPSKFFIKMEHLFLSQVCPPLDNPLPKHQNQWSDAEGCLANQDKKLKSIIISFLLNDVMKSVIKCKTTKEMWNDLILAHEGPSDTRDTKIVSLRLKFNAFKSLKGEKVNRNFARLKCLLNDLENNGVVIPQAKVNATDESIANLYAEYHEKALLANLKRFYKRPARVGSARKPMDKSKETCYTWWKQGHFQKDNPSSITSTPSYPLSHNSFNKSKFYTPSFTQITLQNTGNHKKDYKVKYKGLKAKMAVLTKRIDDFSKGKSEKGKSKQERSEKGLIVESFNWDDDSVSSKDERITKIRAFMAITEDEPSGKADARSGQWVDITMKKVHKLLSMTDRDERKHVLDYTHVEFYYVEDEKKNLFKKSNVPKQELSLHKSKLCNLNNNVSINCSLQNKVIRVNLENESLKDDISKLKKEPLPPLHKLIGVEPVGTSINLISLADLKSNMAKLTLNTTRSKKTNQKSNKMSQTYVIKKKTKTKPFVVPKPCTNKKADSSIEKLLTLMEEEVYVQQPLGFESSEHLDYVCKLDKALWAETSSQSMASETVKAGLATLGLFDEKDTLLSSSDLINSSSVKMRYFSPRWRVLMESNPFPQVFETQPAEEPVAIIDITQSLDASESVEEQVIHPQTVVAEKVLDQITDKELKDAGLVSMEMSPLSRSWMKFICKMSPFNNRFEAADSNGDEVSKEDTTDNLQNASANVPAQSDPFVVTFELTTLTLMKAVVTLYTSSINLTPEKNSPEQLEEADFQNPNQTQEEQGSGDTTMAAVHGEQPPAPPILKSVNNEENTMVLHTSEEKHPLRTNDSGRSKSSDGGNEKAKKPGIPPPHELSNSGIQVNEKKKRSSEILKVVFVQQDIIMDGMHRNLVPPQEFVGSRGLVITEPEDRIFYYNGNFNLDFKRESEFHLANTTQLIKILDDFQRNTPEAEEMYKRLQLAIEARMICLRLGML